MAKIEFFNLHDVLTDYCLILDRSRKFFHATRYRLVKRAFEPAQNPVRFAKRELDDAIGARLRPADRINAQLRRVARRPNMRDIAVAEIDADTVKHVDSSDGVKAEGRREKAR